MPLSTNRLKNVVCVVLLSVRSGGRIGRCISEDEHVRNIVTPRARMQCHLCTRNCHQPSMKVCFNLIRKTRTGLPRNLLQCFTSSGDGFWPTIPLARVTNEIASVRGPTDRTRRQNSNSYRVTSRQGKGKNCGNPNPTIPSRMSLDAWVSTIF